MYLFFKNFWKTLVWACIIIVLSLMPADNIHSQNWYVLPHQDKILHLLFYGIFGFLLIKAFQAHFKRPRMSSTVLILSLSLILAFGAILEIIQEKMIQSREGEVLDLLFDLIGFLIACIYIYFVQYYKRHFNEIKG